MMSWMRLRVLEVKHPEHGFEVLHGSLNEPTPMCNSACFMSAEMARSVWKVLGV